MGNGEFSDMSETPELFRKVDLTAETNLELIFFTLQMGKLRESMINMYLHKDLNFDNGVPSNWLRDQLDSLDRV